MAELSEKQEMEAAMLESQVATKLEDERNADELDRYETARLASLKVVGEEQERFEAERQAAMQASLADVERGGLGNEEDEEMRVAQEKAAQALGIMAGHQDQELRTGAAPRTFLAGKMDAEVRYQRDREVANIEEEWKAVTQRRIDEASANVRAREAQKRADEALTVGRAMEEQESGAPGADAIVEQALYMSGDSDAKEGFILGRPHIWERHSEAEYNALAREIAGALYPKPGVRNRLPYLRVFQEQLAEIRDDAITAIRRIAVGQQEEIDGEASEVSQDQRDEDYAQLADEKGTLDIVIIRLDEEIANLEERGSLSSNAVSDKGDERIDDLLVGQRKTLEQATDDAIQKDQSTAIRITRWMRRNWLGVTGLAATIIALIIGITTSTRKATQRAAESARSAANSAGGTGAISSVFKGSASVISWFGSNLWAIPTLIVIVYMNNVAGRAGKKGRRR